MTTYDIGVDWNNDRFVNLDARPGDALNVVLNPVTWNNIEFNANGGATITKKVFANNETFGAYYINVITGAGLTDGLNIDNTGIDQIPVAASTNYMLKFWQRGNSGLPFSTLNIIIKDQAANILLNSAGNSLTSSWGTIEKAFTTVAGSTHVWVQISKTNEATVLDYDISGLMVTIGTTAPSGFNDGTLMGLNDNINADMQEITWAIGMSTLGLSANESSANIVLNNEARKYSPENTSSVLSGDLKSNRFVIIKSTDSGTERTMWTGFTDSIQPQPFSLLGESKTIIECIGVKQNFDKITHNSNYTNLSLADDVLREILPVGGPFLTDSRGFWKLGGTNFSELGITSFLFDEANVYNFEVGVQTFVNVGENFIDSPTVGAIINSLMETERGRFYIDRSGKYTFWNRNHTKFLTSNDGTITDMQGMEYKYGEDVVNKVTTQFGEREVGATSTTTLFTLQTSMVVKALETIIFEVNWTDDSDAAISADQIDIATITKTSADLEVSLISTSRSGTITLNNISTSSSHTLSVLTITGRKITIFDVSTTTVEDSSSILEFGEKPLELQTKMLDSVTEAKTLAQFELLKFAQPKAFINSITLMNKNQSFTAQILGTNIGDNLNIQEYMTGHDSDHIVVGEEHTVRNNTKTHIAKFILEPAIGLNFWILGQTGNSELESTTVVA